MAHLIGVQDESMIDTLLLDWGNTVMVDFPQQSGPMYRWPWVETLLGAEQSLSRLSQRYCCCLATNAADSTRQDIRQALDRVAIGQYFREIFCYRDIGHAKPSAEFFAFILASLGKEKANLVMIGDDLEKDYLGPMRYGVRAVLFDPCNIAPPGMLRVASWVEIEGMIETLNRSAVA
ncbi:MAG: HAD family hydrolase [Candidatus Competibacteraceae bacterium]|nr:MAG: HAD family hydrolase [Candidatus Competibacteraceae bacterium]